MENLHDIMVIVENGNLEKAIRRIQKLFFQHIKKELRRREGFESRTQRRKAKDRASLRRQWRWMKKHKSEA